MHEPSVRTSRLAIAGGFIAAIVLSGAGFILGRATAPTAPAVQRTEPVVQPTPAATPTPDMPDLFRRADMIALAGRAAEALVSGQRPPDDVAKAIGRRFQLVLPFGCTDSASADSKMRWSYDETAQTLRVSVDMTRWQASDWDLAGDNVSADGFWIARPWSAAESCPNKIGRAIPEGIEPITLPGQTLAIAQFSDNDSPRRDRPFEIVQRVTPDNVKISQGLRLLVSGRIASRFGVDPVRCIQPAGTEQRPICVLSVRLDEVRIENPASGQMLGTWPIQRAETPTS